jgi:hypothetical protein
MPDPMLLVNDAENLLKAPIDTYFDDLDGGANATGAALNQCASAERAALLDTFNAAAVLAGDGLLSAPVQARLQTLKSEQLSYLSGFMKALPSLTRVQAEFRAASYARSIGQAVSELSTLYIPKLPVYPGDPNQLICKFMCKCWLDVERIDTRAYDVYWKLSNSEHCESCLALNEAWSPLEIRDGVVLGHYPGKISVFAEAVRTWLIASERTVDYVG